MRHFNLLIKCLSKYFDVAYFIKFIIVLVAFYYFNILYLGVTDPKNYYSPFLDRHLNYISWFISSILLTAKFINNAFGLDPVVAGIKIGITKGASVLLNFACLGFGIMSFWLAFIIAHKGGWKKKLAWCLTGILTIWFINCWRIAILLLALQNRWKGNKYFDHHDLFNIAAYVLILKLIYLYTDQSKRSQTVFINAEK